MGIPATLAAGATVSPRSVTIVTAMAETSQHPTWPEVPRASRVAVAVAAILLAVPAAAWALAAYAWGFGDRLPADNTKFAIYMLWPFALVVLVSLFLVPRPLFRSAPWLATPARREAACTALATSLVFGVFAIAPQMTALDALLIYITAAATMAGVSIGLLVGAAHLGWLGPR